MLNLLKSFINFCIPTTCVLCGSLTRRKLALCQACDASLPRIQNACESCGIPLLQNAICGECLLTPPHFARTVALFQYQTPINYCVTTLKFQQQLVFARVLGQLLAQRVVREFAEISQAKPNCIIPVPLHPKRLRERGFNQALEIAKPLAKMLKIPLLRNHCIRVRHTNPQSATTANSRKQNIKNAFRIVKPVPAYVVIVDDVVTTMQTVNELSLCLRKAGVQRVDVWCCARTELGKSDNH